MTQCRQIKDKLAYNLNPLTNQNMTIYKITFNYLTGGNSFFRKKREQTFVYLNSYLLNDVYFLVKIKYVIYIII